MFYSHELLNIRNGRLSAIWIIGCARACVGKNMLAMIKKVNIESNVKELLKYVQSRSEIPQQRFAMRLSATLLRGIVRVYRKQLDFFEAEVLVAIQLMVVKRSVTRTGHRERGENAHRPARSRRGVALESVVEEAVTVPEETRTIPTEAAVTTADAAVVPSIVEPPQIEENVSMDILRHEASRSFVNVTVAHDGLRPLQSSTPLDRGAPQLLRENTSGIVCDGHMQTSAVENMIPQDVTAPHVDDTPGVVSMIRAVRKTGFEFYVKLPSGQKARKQKPVNMNKVFLLRNEPSSDENLTLLTFPRTFNWNNDNRLPPEVEMFRSFIGTVETATVHDPTLPSVQDPTLPSGQNITAITQQEIELHQQNETVPFILPADALQRSDNLHFTPSAQKSRERFTFRQALKQKLLATLLFVIVGRHVGIEQLFADWSRADVCKVFILFLHWHRREAIVMLTNEDRYVTGIELNEDADVFFARTFDTLFDIQ